MIHSLDVRNIEGFDLVWYESGLFMVSLIITLLTIAIVLVMMVLHYLVWEPSYNKNVDDEKDAKFDRSEWINEKCNLYFSYIKRRETNNIEELADPAIEK